MRINIRRMGNLYIVVFRDFSRSCVIERSFKERYEAEEFAIKCIKTIKL